MKETELQVDSTIFCDRSLLRIVDGHTYTHLHTHRHTHTHTPAHTHPLFVYEDGVSLISSIHSHYGVCVDLKFRSASPLRTGFRTIRTQTPTDTPLQWSQGRSKQQPQDLRLWRDRWALCFWCHCYRLTFMTVFVVYLKPKWLKPWSSRYPLFAPLPALKRQSIMFRTFKNPT